MGLSAHPDDEDGATLAHYAILQNITTYSIFYTRGEGGQNETGPELYGELGAVRTRETLEAAKILHTQAGFLGFPDFGYSKTAKETFEKWGGEDSVLARVVYVIRAVKPDIIITNHDTVTIGPGKQHGNHQAVGITAYEAFIKAADPSYHPEQLHGAITPWQVKKLYFRDRIPADSTSDSSVTIDMNAFYQPSISIEDVAVQALSQHKSQGLGTLVADSIPRQWRVHRYRLMRSDRNYFIDDEDLFSGIDASVRPSYLPQDVVPDTTGKFSMTVTPAATSFGADTGGRNATRRTFVLHLGNTTGKPLNIEVLGSFQNSRIFQKAYTLGADSARAALDDTVRLIIDHRRLRSSAKLLFIASPSGKGLGPLHLLPVKTGVDIDPMSGTASPQGRIGLVKTYDNTLEETMQAFDLPYVLLDSTMLATGGLGQYSVILLDLRFGEFRPDAVRSISRLLDYEKEGGNIVAFYNKPPDWKGKQLAPFPLTLTTDRVTDEDAKVTVLLPDHPLLTRPNVITSGDWAGWVQERSIYLPDGDTARTASSFQRLLAMSDEGERQPPTSLLWARDGKGTYTYVALALYRQLRILQPGAEKLFFNMISQGRGK